MNVRDRVIAAVKELACERGLNDITVDEMAAGAGISKRTLYRYFGSKEGVIEAVLDSVIEELTQEIRSLVDREKDIAGVLTGAIRYILQNGKFIINAGFISDLKQRYPQLWSKIERIRAENIRWLVQVMAGRGDPVIRDLDPRILTACVTASIQAVLNPDFLLANNLTVEEAAVQLQRFLLRSV
ncbi:MAG: TetR-like transcriptional regulator [Thermacetogenium phaeum]|uniref:TetR-like transcriptional regulator n=1 Tax=Thermacetogenium phaeum TaxID=85874 RepID=A0A124FK60_9THEO|nr:MAG: TetR-like transcriptional regulator [Thermacetogenium phaeum]